MLGTGTSYEGSGWTENKITSGTALGSGTYDHTFEISGSNINVYSLSNNVDPRSANVNDIYVVFQVEGVVNPAAKFAKTSLSFSLATCRYTYSGGPMLVYDESTVTFSDDLVAGTVSSPKCDFSNSAKYGSYINSK